MGFSRLIKSLGPLGEHHQVHESKFITGLIASDRPLIKAPFSIKLAILCKKKNFCGSVQLSEKLLDSLNFLPAGHRPPSSGATRRAGQFSEAAVFSLSPWPLRGTHGGHVSPRVSPPAPSAVQHRFPSPDSTRSPKASRRRWRGRGVASTHSSSPPSRSEGTPLPFKFRPLSVCKKIQSPA